MKRVSILGLFVCSTAIAGFTVYVDGDRTYDNLSLGCPSILEQIVDREGYALGFSKEWKQPAWVTYRLTSEEASVGDVKRSNNFKTDRKVLGSATPGDYLHTEYDRGHLAPAADMQWSTNVMEESFLMTNMSPQTPSLNRDVWKRAETFARKCAIKEGSVFIVSGPIVTNETPVTIGQNNVVVPDLFYKVIYDETPPEKMVAFVFPNTKISGDIWDYATNVVYAEEMSGLTFFPAVSTNKTAILKATFIKEDWVQ